jgi:monoterpene epsilon-lactone hydrolase
LLAGGTAWFVAARRLLKGPRHPGWDFRYELLATVLRIIQQRILRMPMTRMRKHTLRARMHPSVSPHVEHARTTFAGLYAEVFTPRGYTPAAPTVLYFHGGGYVSCSPGTHRDLVSRIALASGARCIVVDYCKAPEHPFPAAIDDCEATYRALLAEGVTPSRIVIAGDSAGGGLALAVLQRARAAALPMPAATVLLSPWVDLSCTGASVQSNAAYDYLSPSALAFGVRHYLQGQDPLHPLASPLYADLRGLPPTLLVTGSAELFLSENLAFAERARAHGVELTHHIGEGMVHVYALFARTLGQRAGIDMIGDYVRRQVAACRAAPERQMRAAPG